MRREFEEDYKKLQQFVESIPDEEVLKRDEQEAYPYVLEEKMWELEIQKYYIPHSLGGEFLHLHELCLIAELLASKDLSLCISVLINILGSLPVWISGSEEQKTRLKKLLLNRKRVCFALSERTRGSDVLSSDSQALWDSKTCRYQVNAEKWLINNSYNADVLVTFLKLPELEGIRSSNFFFIEKEELQKSQYRNIEKIKTLGARSAHISGFSINNATVKESSLIGRKGTGFETMLKTLHVSRTACGAMSLGLLKKSVEIVSDFAKSRTLYSKQLVDFAESQRVLSQAMATYFVAKDVLRFSADLIDSKAELGALSSSIVKYFIPDLVEKELFQLKSVYGARHYLREDDIGQFYCFQKILRDSALVGLFDGSSHVNLAYLANLLKSQLRSKYSPEEALLLFDEYRKHRAKIDFSKLKSSFFHSEFVLESLKSSRSRRFIGEALVDYLMDRYDAERESFSQLLQTTPDVLESEEYFTFAKLYSRLYFLSVYAAIRGEDDTDLEAKATAWLFVKSLFSEDPACARILKTYFSGLSIPEYLQNGEKKLQGEKAFLSEELA